MEEMPAAPTGHNHATQPNAIGNPSESTACQLATQNKSQEKPRGNTKNLKVPIRDGDMLKQETKTSKRQTCIRTAQAHPKTKVTKINKI